MPYSYSQISSYRRCPRQYEYAFVKKLERPLSAGESFGVSMHSTMKKWGELEIARRTPDDGVRDDQLKLFMSDAPAKPVKELTFDALQEIWHSSFIVEGYSSRIEADHRRIAGEAMLKEFFAWWSTREREVVAVEKGFKLSLPDSNAIITGRFDRVERVSSGLLVVDFKTGYPRDQESVDADLQLSIYALAATEVWKEPVEELVLLFFTEDGIIERTTKRSASQLKDAQISMKSVLERIESRDFHPTPSKEKCSHCPYRTICDVAAA